MSKNLSLATDDSYLFVATCAFGLESVVNKELKDLGFSEVQAFNGQVYFRGGVDAFAKANLWLRSADRVYWELSSFEVSEFEDLYQGVLSIPWERYLDRNACFPVTGHSVHSTLTSIPACQSVAKKAVVERLKQKYNQSWFDESGATYPIKFHMVKDICKIRLDTSGHGLHRRGYRLDTGEAPLRETLAAGMVSLSYWRADRPLVDPMCGSGTILIEAAFQALNRAPGLTASFVCEEWKWVPRVMFQEARQEAEDLFDRTTTLEIHGFDKDFRVLKAARENLYRAELFERGVFVETKSLEDFKSTKKYACCITNPPYGERLEDQEEAERILTLLGQKLEPHETWSVYVLTPEPRLAKFLGRKEDKKRKLYNGLIQCYYHMFRGPRPPRP